MTAKELIQKYKRGERDFNKAILCHADLSGVNLRESNLRGANLYNADLTNADLSEADLRSSNLSKADLRSSHLSNADLSNANLYGTKLSGADLSEADLSNANLKYAIGNGREVLSLILKWWVVMTKDSLAIEGEQYPIDEWWEFPSKDLEETDPGSKGWWKTHKPLLKALHKTFK